MYSKLTLSLLALVLLVRIITSYFIRHEVEKKYEGKVTVTGTLQDEPQTTAKVQIFSLAGLQIVKAKLPELSYGDTVEITGEVDYSERRPKILFPQVRTLVNPNKSLPLEHLFIFRNNLIDFFQKTLPEPGAGLMSGILLGYKSGLDSQVKQMILNTGLTHVVVASGTNLTFVAGLIFGFAMLVAGRRWANLIAIPVIWLYALMTGFDAAVIRAGIMVTLMYISRFLGRPTSAWRPLVIAVYIMILFDPSYLTNLSFQLSVAAMTGIITSADFSKESPFKGVSFLTETLFAQLWTLPLIIGTFGQYGLLSLAANALTLWTIPFIMVVGTVAGLIGLIFPGIGAVTIIPAHFLLSYFITVIEFFGSFSSLVLTLPRLDPTAILGVYLIMIAFYVKRRTNKLLGRPRS